MDKKNVEKLFDLPITNGAGSKGLFVFNKLRIQHLKNSFELSESICKKKRTNSNKK